MSWRLLLAIISLFWVGGCGVKGDPLPPEKPAELGRGRPTYKRATESIEVKRRRYQEDEDETDTDEEERESDED
ncbi:MAG: lipoprotein [Bdellovibrionales bacterium]